MLKNWFNRMVKSYESILDNISPCISKFQTTFIPAEAPGPTSGFPATIPPAPPSRSPWPAPAWRSRGSWTPSNHRGRTAGKHVGGIGVPWGSQYMTMWRRMMRMMMKIMTFNQESDQHGSTSIRATPRSWYFLFGASLKFTAPRDT